MSDEFHVVIPDESYRLVEFRQEGLPGVGVINGGLTGFEPRVAFRWHLSVVVALEDLVDNGMPSQQERESADSFGDDLDARLKGAPEHPNALFLARITWNGTRELVYRVYDPKVANDLLQDVIQSEFYPLEFDFRMDDDPEWKLAEWHLQAGLQ